MKVHLSPQVTVPVSLGTSRCESSDEVYLDSVLVVIPRLYQRWSHITPLHRLQESMLFSAQRSQSLPNTVLQLALPICKLTHKYQPYWQQHSRTQHPREHAIL